MVSVNFNLATYRGEQGFSGAGAFVRAARVYVSGGFAGSTVKGLSRRARRRGVRLFEGGWSGPKAYRPGRSS